MAAESYIRGFSLVQSSSTTTIIMKASTTLSLLTLTAIASAAKSFNLVTIRSGSNLQYASVYNKDGNVLLGSGDSLEFVLNDDGSLIDKASGKQISANDQKYIVEGSQKDTNFAIKDNHLAYGGKEVFVACPSADNTYQLALSGFCKQPVGVALRVEGLKDIDTPPKTVTPTTTVKAASTPAPKDNKKPEAPSDKEEKTFGLVAVRSGTKFQYNPIKKVESHPHVFSVGGTEGEDVKLTLKKDGTLVDQNGRGILVRSSGEFGDVSPWGDENPSKGFAIKDSNLEFNGKQEWKACPSGENQFSLAVNDCTGGTGIALHIV